MVTTDSEHSLTIAENWLAGDFSPMKYVENWHAGEAKQAA